MEGCSDENRRGIQEGENEKCQLQQECGECELFDAGRDNSQTDYQVQTGTRKHLDYSLFGRPVLGLVTTPG